MWWNHLLGERKISHTKCCTMQRVCFSSFIINKTLKWENAELCLREEATVWVCCWCYVAFIVCLKETQQSHHSAVPPGRNTQESLWVCYVLYMQLLSVDFSFEAPDSSSGFHLQTRGWAIIWPHQAWRDNQYLVFLSHGVFSQMIKPLTVCWLPACFYKATSSSE